MQNCRTAEAETRYDRLGGYFKEARSENFERKSRGAVDFMGQNQEVVCLYERTIQEALTITMVGSNYPSGNEHQHKIKWLC